MKAILVIVSCSWKFAATFPVAIYLFNMTFFETILFTNIGGLLGIIVFTLLFKNLIKLFDALKPLVYGSKKKKKLFTKRNRYLIILKNKYGLLGIVVLTPFLLSIPVGVFLNTKYYGHNKYSYLYLLIGQITWSFVYTLFYFKIKILI